MPALCASCSPRAILPGMGLNYNSPGALRAFLDERGLGARKRFGQNFLIDGRARERLLDALGCPPGSAVWEVGPGLGAITSGLLDRGMRVTAFEVDGGFAAALEEFFGGSVNFRLVRGDVLRTWPVVAGEYQQEGNKDFQETGRALP